MIKGIRFIYSDPKYETKGFGLATLDGIRFTHKDYAKFVSYKDIFEVNTLNEKEGEFKFRLLNRYQFYQQNQAGESLYNLDVPNIIDYVLRRTDLEIAKENETSYIVTLIGKRGENSSDWIDYEIHSDRLLVFQDLYFVIEIKYKEIKSVHYDQNYLRIEDEQTFMLNLTKGNALFIIELIESHKQPNFAQPNHL